MTNEQEARLDDIRNGPWREKSQYARTQLPLLSESDKRRYLRFHFPEAIRERAEFEFRDSFDQGLEELQLLELAVACGFLPLEALRGEAEREFSALLSSQPAREYVRIYDFVPVRYLAARLEIDLRIGRAQPPPINPHGEVRYAIFLSTHYEFIANPRIRRFTMFIDDYRFGGIHAGMLKRQLNHQDVPLTPTEEAVVSEGCLGMIQFVETLGDFFLQVPADEQPYFGLAYGYWLSHFYGLRRPEGSYEERATGFGDIKLNAGLLDPDLAPEAIEAERRRFDARMQALRVVWDATRRLIESLN